MATPTETAGRAPGFGARRFLVRGQDFASEETLAIVRPRITDYPERPALAPEFPGPGRRGGSRPRAQSAEQVEALRDVGSLYPIERERVVDRVTNSLSGLTAEQTASLASARGVGFPRTHRAQVVAGATDVVATVPLPGPALITRLEVYSDITAISPFVDVGFKYSTDDNTTGGFGTTGSRFFLAGAGVFDANLGLDPMVWTPNVLVPHQRWFLKIIIRNNQAGTINVITAYSVEWL